MPEFDRNDPESMLTFKRGYPVSRKIDQDLMEAEHSDSPKKASVRVIMGERIKKWGGWYRHDQVEVDGVVLEGTIQTRTNGRGGTESSTGYGSAGVLGVDIKWLARQNGVEL